MKTLLVLLFLLFALPASAEYINLDDEVVLKMGYCELSGKVYRCAVAKHEGKLYVLAVDNKGPIAEWEIDGEKAILIWVRDSI